MKKRLLSVLLLVCMVLTLLPTAALAEDVQEDDHAHTPVCICETACTADAMNEACPVCGAEDAQPDSCALYTEEPVTEEADLEDEDGEAPEAPEELEEIEEPEDDAAPVLAPQLAEDGIAVHAAHTHCFCGGNVNAGDHTSHKNVTYTAYNNASSLEQILNSDDVIYAYLTNNITLDRLYLPEGKTLYLCLNGHRITFDEYQVTLNNNTTLYLCDCSTENTGTISRSAGKTCCVLVSGENATFNMYGGTLRDGNSTGHGGGVKLEKGTMNMYGGTITNNTATSDGGGIYVGTKGALNLYGGTITKNTINVNEARYGGGVYVESNDWSGVGKISISGSPVITGNTRVYTDATTGAETTSTDNLHLAHGFTNSGDLPTIELGTLTSGANIGVSTRKNVAFSTASETDYSEYFFSDDTGYHVEYQDDQKLYLISGAAHVHSGGTATCTQRAVCSTCGKEYGDLAAHDFTAQVAEEQYLTSAADCEKAAVYYKSCAVCGLSSKDMEGEATFTSGDILGHNWGNWTSNGNYTHTRVCSRDASHTETENCTGGTADCQHKAVCTVCGGEYGELTSHKFTAETVDGKYLKSAATCENAAVYYKSCTGCGLSSKGTPDEATFESGDFAPHRFTAETVAEDYLKSAADCEHAAVYYKSCAVCGLTSAGTADEATFESGNATGHSWGQVTYNWAETEPTPVFACTAKRVCQNDSTHVETETVTAVYLVDHEPTCLGTGHGAYTASFENDWAGLSQLDVTLPALGHDFGAWTSNGDGTHTRVCSRDASHTESGSCTGGTATCTEKAVCEVCGGAYGELASHSFTAETVDAKYLKSAATCTEKAVYYKSCSACGLTSKGTADEATFESGSILGHDYGAWTSRGDGTHTRVCSRDASHTETGDCTGGTATCTEKAVCEVCGGAYGAIAPDNHTGKLAWDITETHHEQAWTCCGKITVAKAAHTFGDWTVTKRPTSREEGEKARTCSVCGYTETKVLPKTGGGPTYYTLVFESNGGSKIANVNERHGTVVDLTLAKYQPTRTGYDFTGWYSDKELTKRVTSVKLYENTTVYAGWSVRNLPFTDVARGDWFFDDVRYVYENGLMNGVTATRFAPYGSTTRGMIVTILYRMEGQPSVSRDCPFTDVASGSYYERAITWAAANGIVTGHSSTIFAPDANITREQLAAILYRYAVYKGLDVSVGEDTNILSYEDFASLSEYAIPAMQWACGAGVLYGSAGKLLPDAPATRAQAAAILHRFCTNILN